MDTSTTASRRSVFLPSGVWETEAEPLPLVGCTTLTHFPHSPLYCTQELTHPFIPPTYSLSPSPIGKHYLGDSRVEGISHSLQWMGPSHWSSLAIPGTSGIGEVLASIAVYRTLGLVDPVGVGCPGCMLPREGALNRQVWVKTPEIRRPLPPFTQSSISQICRRADIRIVVYLRRQNFLKTLE